MKTKKQVPKPDAKISSQVGTGQSGSRTNNQQSTRSALGLVDETSIPSDIRRRLPLKIHHDLSLLVMKLLLVLGVGLRLTVFLMQINFQAVAESFLLNNGTRIGLILFTFFLMIAASLYLIIWWNNDYYLVTTDTEEKIAHRQGVFWTKRQALRFPTLDYFKLKKPLLGKIFNFGTILLRSSETQEEMMLKNIPRPHYYLQIFRELTPRAERV